MFRVIYKVPVEEKESEHEWLKSMLIFPVVTEELAWFTGKTYARFGMIITPEQLTVIKLRRNIDTQLPYSA